jgi:hypothetical protein
MDMARSMRKALRAQGFVLTGLDVLHEVKAPPFMAA